MFAIRVIRIVVALAVAALAASAGSAGAVTGWSSAGSMAVPRDGATATALGDGRVLIAGGLNRRIADYVSSAEIYDPNTNSWSPAGSMIGARGGHTATRLLDGKVLVVGGAIRSGLGAVMLSSAEIYDPATNAWTSAGNMAHARSGHTASLLPDGRVLVAGGIDSSGTGQASAELYDPATNGWSAAGSMSTGRAGFAATSLPDGSVLVTGGLAGYGSGAVPVPSSEIYSPGTNAWRSVASMATPHALHTATALGNGRVLVVDGISGTMGPSTWSSIAELYDPATNTWTGAGATTAPRNGHTATLLGNGTVLVVGGAAAGGGFLSSSEIYDPATNGWSSGPSMATPRTGHTATALANGKVLVAGGWDQSSAELYGDLPQCRDHVDNDGDGLIDFPADPGCTSVSDNDEFNPTPDREAPSATLSGRRVQRLGNSVTVILSCRSTTENCITTATGTLTVTRAARVFRLKGVKRRIVVRGRKATLRLGLPRTARTAAARALRKRQAVRAKITTRVADTAGNTATLRRTIKLKR